MDTTAKLRGVRLSPQKGRLVADQIRGKTVENALNILQFSPKRGAVIIRKVLESAIANAEHNLELDRETLVVATAYVDQGKTLNRIQPRAQGRAYRIRRRTSHITIELESRPELSKSARAQRGAKGRTR